MNFQLKYIYGILKNTFAFNHRKSLQKGKLILLLWIFRKIIRSQTEGGRSDNIEWV